MPIFGCTFFKEKKHEQTDQVTVIIDDHLDSSENNLNSMLEIARRYSNKIDAKYITDLDLQDNPQDAAENIYKLLIAEEQAQASALEPKYDELYLNMVLTLLGMGGGMAGAATMAGFLGWAVFVGGQSVSACIPAVTIGAEVGGGLGTCMGISGSISLVKEFLKSNSFIAHRTLKSELLEFKRHCDEFFAFPLQYQATENRSICLKR